MKYKIQTLILLCFFCITTNLVAQVFTITPTTTIQYSGNEGNENFTINLSKINYGKTVGYSFTDNISYNKKGKVTIPAYDVLNGNIAQAPSAITDRSEKFATNNSGIWMNKTKFDSIIKFQIYNEYDVAEEASEQVPFVMHYTAKRIRQAIIVNNKSQLIDAYQLTSDTLKGESFYGQLQFTIQNNANNPILLQSSSTIWHPNIIEPKRNVYELWLKKVSQVKLVK